MTCAKNSILLGFLMSFFLLLYFQWKVSRNTHPSLWNPYMVNRSHGKDVHQKELVFLRKLYFFIPYWEGYKVLSLLKSFLSE